MGLDRPDTSEGRPHARLAVTTFMSALQRFFRSTFAALAVRNYRLFFLGQAISLSGSWMQRIAQGLLVLDLTGSGTALGVVVALQALPVLIFGAWGGVAADRLPKRSILYATQAVAGVSSLVIGLLVISGDIRLWMVYAAALVLGFVKVFDNPTRQTFVREMVGSDLLTNAVSLNSIEMNFARVVGPAVAGVLVATIGLGACFIADGLSYTVVIAMLAVMRSEELRPAQRVARSKGQLTEGLRYVRSQPVIRNTLVMMAIIGTFTYEVSVVLPLLAEFTFARGAGGYAALTSAMGMGAVIGGLYTASRRRTGPAVLVLSAALFGAAMVLASVSPTMTLALVAMVVVGFFSINFTSLANVTIQLASASQMQGRVMSLWTIAMLGTTPIGGPIMGYIGEHAGARWALGLGGLAALVAAAVGLHTVRKMEAERAQAERNVVVPDAPGHGARADD